MSQRAIRQYLESLQRAGITHLPKVVPQPPGAPAAAPEPVTAPPVQQQPAAPAPPVATPSVVAPPVVQAPPPTPAKPADLALPVETVVAAAAAPVPLVDANASADARQAILTQVAARVSACTKCAELADSRTQTVFGVGNPNARIMFIGEAPGADEDRLGEPSVGNAGQLLDKIIVACKLKREDVYICNILRCRPPGNRNPSPTEAVNCREFLDAQIGTVQPEYIVCLGSVAAQNLLNQTTSISKLRGQFYQHGDAKVLCTYHPSYLLRNPKAKSMVWDDMKLLFGDMGVTL